jgi:predicted AAA+ superfamily ATPase
LWGPRQSGKSTWIKHQFPIKQAIMIDLLKSDVYQEYAQRPALLRERFAEDSRLWIVIDEVQKVPELMDEIHWMIENTSKTFLLTGSSARKLRKAHANLLAGRARRKWLLPLCLHEIPREKNLEKLMQTGLIPSHYTSAKPDEDIRSYIGDYLKEEIASEALVQRLPIFSEFLRISALTSGEMLNYQNIAQETGVSSHTIRSYFQVLEDTFLGFRLPAWKKRMNRRLNQTDKFYLFDLGIVNSLIRRKPSQGTSEFGKGFEHLMTYELKAFQAYQNPDLPLSYWRTVHGHEVDLILGDMEVAIEWKAKTRITDSDVSGLKLLQSEHPIKKLFLVCLEKEPRKVDGIKIIPWRNFIEELWSGNII